MISMSVFYNALALSESRRKSPYDPNKSILKCKPETVIGNCENEEGYLPTLSAAVFGR
jgi:hypothetical protein